MNSIEAARETRANLAGYLSAQQGLHFIATTGLIASGGSAVILSGSGLLGLTIKLFGGASLLGSIGFSAAEVSCLEGFIDTYQERLADLRVLKNTKSSEQLLNEVDTLAKSFAAYSARIVNDLDDYLNLVGSNGQNQIFINLRTTDLLIEALELKLSILKEDSESCLHSSFNLSVSGSIITKMRREAVCASRVFNLRAIMLQQAAIS